MIELRRHVERIVRPIRGSNWRKDRMCEELLAHLTQLYESERADGKTTEQAAQATACERFGNPDALRAELQETVPALERFLLTPVPVDRWQARRAGESVLAHVRRIAPRATLVHAAVWLLFILALGLFGSTSRAVSLRDLTWMNIAYVTLFPIPVFGPLLLCDRIRALSHGSSLPKSLAERLARALRIGVYAVAASLCEPTMVALLWMLFHRATGVMVFSGTWMVGLVVGWMCVRLPLVALQVKDLQRFEDWTGLSLVETQLPA